jgi:hypothetical protein
MDDEILRIVDAIAEDVSSGDSRQDGVPYRDPVEVEHEIA